MECQTVSSASRFGSDRNVPSYSLFSLVGRKRDFTKLKFPRDQMVKTGSKRSTNGISPGDGRIKTVAGLIGEERAQRK